MNRMPELPHRAECSASVIALALWVNIGHYALMVSAVAIETPDDDRRITMRLERVTGEAM